MKTREQAAQERAEAGVKAAHRPSQRRAWADVEDGPRGFVLGGTMAARAVTGVQLRAADDVHATGPGVVGVASTTETPYLMYDMFGPYHEIVSASAFDVTLAADPLVEFALNHGRGGGAPMAHTRNGTLALGMTDEGLAYDASVDGTRHDVSDMLKALERGDLAESSFKFTIDAGRWNDAMDTFTIMQVDLDRGDVSSVNFGANPTTSSSARSAAELLARLQTGRALDAEDVNMLTQAMAWFTAVDSIVDEAQEALALYLKVPSPDPDDAGELADVKPAALRHLPELRTIPGI